MLTSDYRYVTGVDFDEEKIIVAKNGFLKNNRIEFIHQDVTRYPLTPKEGILLGDVLHYLPPDEQEFLLRSCMNNLKPGGVLVIRDGDTGMTSKHKRTQWSEFLSTRVLHFNQTSDARGQLWFISSESIRKLAESVGLSFRIVDPGKQSSNIFMIIQ